MAKQLGLISGLLGFAFFVALASAGGFLSKLGFSLESLPPPDALKVAGVAFLMAAWWVTEAIPIPATSLLPLALFPVLRVQPFAMVSNGYSDKFILLLMGGFFIALALERWNLHRRIALGIIVRVGTEPTRLVLGFMLAGALLSMWISNTATTLMMLPIAIAVIQRMEENVSDPKQLRPMGIALMLGIAYACNVGGLGTPIGTPPNLVYLQNYAEAFPDADLPTFVDWFLLTAPFVVVMLGVIWWILTRGMNRIDPNLRVGDADTIQDELTGMGRLNTPERRALAVFVITALLWIFRKPITIAGSQIGGWSPALGLDGLVEDGTVAIGAALVMFLLPAGPKHPGEKLLDWETAVRIPWGLLLLFGGGLSLASGFKSTGLSEWIGHGLAQFADLPLWALIGLICLSVTFLTEITSNTATTTILMPILASVCVEHQIDPNNLMLPAALSASCAFMLPVATAPNAIVFGTGRVTMGDMVRCGFAINLAGVLLLTAWLLV